MADARSTALEVLLKIEQDKAYSNLALNHAIKGAALSHADSAFASALVYGVLERQITLDYIIRQYSKIPLRKIETKTKLILRLGVLQLVFMDKVPESAAVNESVKLAKKHKLQKSSGFINALLRNITRAEVKYTLPSKDDTEYYFSVKYSVPRELVRLWVKAYGAYNAEELMKSLSGRPKLCARVNTLKTDVESLIQALAEEGVAAEPAPFVENALYLSGTGSVEGLNAFKNGLFHIQDASSQLCVSFLEPKQGQLMLDVCSAPGGKSCTAAQYMNNSGEIIACDLYEGKLRLIEKNARRLGVSCVRTLCRNASAENEPLPKADRILCDVPCSGLGILARKPEIRYKDGLLDSSLPGLQYEILCRSAEALKEGGRLVYSTCTLNPAENGENTQRFLREHPDFFGMALTLPEGVERAFDEEPYELTLMPHTAHTDGFYIAVFGRRRADE